MDQERYNAFRQRLIDDPYDQATRLVFADFLEEHGREEEASIQREWTPESHRKATEIIHELAWGTGMTLSGAIEAMTESLDTGLGIELGIDGDLPDICYDDRIWEAYSILTGRTVPKDVGYIFTTCGC